MLGLSIAAFIFPWIDAATRNMLIKMISGGRMHTRSLSGCRALRLADIRVRLADVIDESRWCSGQESHITLRYPKAKAHREHRATVGLKEKCGVVRLQISGCTPSRRCYGWDDAAYEAL